MVAALQAKAAAPRNATAAPQATSRRDAWALMRERVRVLSSDNRAATLAYYADNLRTKPEFDTPARRYGYALALLANNQPERALQQLQPLLQAEPDNLAMPWRRPGPNWTAGSGRWCTAALRRPGAARRATAPSTWPGPRLCWPRPTAPTPAAPRICCAR